MSANFDVNDSFLNERPISNNAEARFKFGQANNGDQLFKASS